MSFVISRATLSNFDEATRHEWLEANGLGGWASSTLIGTNTRRYHGLLIAAESPSRRWLLLSRFEETLVLGKKRFELSTNEFANASAKQLAGTIHPQGYEFLERFERAAAVHSDFRVGGFLVRKSVLALHGENSTLLRYELCEGPSACLLELRPLVAARDIHALTSANDAMQRHAHFENGLLRCASYSGVPDLSIRIDQGRFVAGADWWKSFRLREEAERGFDCVEDLFSPGVLHLALFPDQPVWVLCSAGTPSSRKSEHAWAKELARREKLSIASKGPLSEQAALLLAADQFIVRKRDKESSVIAGYPWFTDWGRDAMISLTGLCLLTKRFDDAKRILLLFREHLQDGLLPNRFPDGGETPEYNSVDASLWAFEAVWQFLQESKDAAFVVSELFPMLASIEQHFRAGTHFGIAADTDGLLRAGDASTQLTWMDAKVAGKPVTPRYGKPVEINALWVNALLILERLSEMAGDAAAAERYRQHADRAADAFLEAFWIKESGIFADCLVPGAASGSWARDEAIRPNQIISLGLSMSFVPEDFARKVIAVVRNELFVGVGLRSLSPRDSRYVAAYRGGPDERDRAYHQGTVWAWLLAPYLRAVARYGGSEEIAQDGERILDALRAHFSESGIGSVSEIFDAEQPYTARGCPFQAWSVAAAIECLHLLGKWPER